MSVNQEIIIDGVHYPYTYKRVAHFRKEKEKLTHYWLHPTGNGWSSLCEVLLMYEHIKKRQIHTVYECGSRRGWSGSWLALALKEIHSPGKLYTFDIESWESIEKDVGVSDKVERIIGRFDEEVPKYLNARPKEPILIYIDGDHSYEGVSKDFKAIEPFLKKKDMVFFNDLDSVKGFGVSKFICELKQNDNFNIIILNTEYGTAILELK